MLQPEHPLIPKLQVKAAPRKDRLRDLSRVIGPAYTFAMYIPARVAISVCASLSASRATVIVASRSPQLLYARGEARRPEAMAESRTPGDTSIQKETGKGIFR